MSLSSSLFTGTSGLKNMGNALQIVGNNISNLNTIGFKKGRSAFADTLYESVATQAGTGQMGRGMSIGNVSQNFDQGSFESTGNTTDLSIGGDGFFIMRQDSTENMFYTRAGNFLFDKDGQLINPEGYVVQGWELDEDTGDDIGAIDDLILEAFTSPPDETSVITAITNLDADSDSNSIVLSNNWEGDEDTNMDASNYEYQTTVKAYDTLGSTHDVTIYYDKITGTEWEYVVTCNPDEDNRNLVQDTDAKGLLARGNITFSESSGDILDLTMSEFTGRIGNFQANGVNTVDDINYEIFDSDELALDGYGFSLEFDGTDWAFTNIPANYSLAEIIYSDDQEIHFELNDTDTEADLKIQLDSIAVATDTLGFDINNVTDLHIQGIDGTTYDGETANDNTNLAINDPSVMTHDSADLGIIWNPSYGTDNSGQWFWSNPNIASSAGTLIANVSVAGVTTAAATIATIRTDASDVSMVATDIQLLYDGADWDWNDALKEVDFTSTYTFSPTNDPAIEVTNQGTQGAIEEATSGYLYWLASSSVWSTTSGSYVASDTFGNMDIDISTASTDTNVIFNIWFDGVGQAGTFHSTVEYTFGSSMSTGASQSIEFVVDPTPPEEYANAVLSNTTPGTSTFSIDFSGDNVDDIDFNPTAAGAVVATNTFIFSTDPDVPPSEYLDATLSGDHEEVVIDLDGSGNDADNDDIVFTFDDSLSYGSTTHPYDDRSEIDFDILGSTAWTEIATSDIEQSGLFAFTADFLGGDYGSTEMDIELDFGSAYDETNWVNDSLSTTQYSKSSSTVYQDADGYAAGDLQGVDVASDGVITGTYSNGQLIPLFRVGLAKFLNNYGLTNEGGNLFSETLDSGSAITNKPGENGLGTISPNSLEMSNVDISEEFVSLITNQRGFQANSKTITTVDDMMQTVIQMKR